MEEPAAWNIGAIGGGAKLFPRILHRRFNFGRFYDGGGKTLGRGKWRGC
jgi:hypothetical protein